VITGGLCWPYVRFIPAEARSQWHRMSSPSVNGIDSTIMPFAPKGLEDHY
jgi:hypothetical protein